MKNKMENGAPSNSKIAFIPSSQASMSVFVLTVGDYVTLDTTNARFAVSEYHIEGDSIHMIPPELSPIKLFVDAGSVVSCASLEDISFLEMKYQPAQ